MKGSTFKLIELSTPSSILSKYNVNVPTAIAAENVSRTVTTLPATYQPGPLDVVCGRGKGCYNRPGNKRFRFMIATYIPQYLASQTKLDKSIVLNNIMDKVRSYKNPDTGCPSMFVKYTSKKVWVEVGDEQAREKVGHAIREAIASQRDGAAAAAAAKSKTARKMSAVLLSSPLQPTTLFATMRDHRQASKQRSSSIISNKHLLMATNAVIGV